MPELSNLRERIFPLAPSLALLSALTVHLSIPAHHFLDALHTKITPEEAEGRNLSAYRRLFSLRNDLQIYKYHPVSDPSVPDLGSSLPYWRKTKKIEKRKTSEISKNLWQFFFCKKGVRQKLKNLHKIFGIVQQVMWKIEKIIGKSILEMRYGYPGISLRSRSCGPLLQHPLCRIRLRRSVSCEIRLTS